MGTHVPSKTGQERLRVAVRLDESLQHAAVELCPQGFRIERLNEPSPGARRWLEGGSMHVGAAAHTFGDADEGVDLPASHEDECVRYTVNLLEKSEDPISLRRVDTDLLASPDTWLWVPTPRPVGVQITARFELPAGVSPLLPWESVGEGEYLVNESAFAWKAAGAFGRREVEERTVNGALVRIGTLGQGFERQAQVQEWIWQGARTSAALYGSLPVRQALVIAVPGERAGPGFGMALRGGGAAIVILLNRQVNAAALAADWTPTHEFLHLGVPRLPPEDAWFFEGLATYYTEVTRARVGLITPAQAYQRLLDGFARGQSDGGSLTLREESAAMRERHSYHRVYWAGAALAFLSDVAARRAGGPTLDTALRSFATCCAASEEAWTAERVLARLDGTLGAPHFSAQAQRWLDSAQFPDVTPALRALGVTAGGGGKAIFGPAPQAAMRNTIMVPLPAVAAQ